MKKLFLTSIAALSVLSASAAHASVEQWKCAFPSWENVEEYGDKDFFLNLRAQPNIQSKILRVLSSMCDDN